MSDRVVDELEERRIARRLACLADAVESLPGEQLDAILSGVVTGTVPRRPASRFRARAGRQVHGAATLAAALALAVGIGHAEFGSNEPRGGGTAPGQLLSFPEGSALELLLSQTEAERPA